MRLDGAWANFISPSVKRSISPEDEVRRFHRERSERFHSYIITCSIGANIIITIGIAMMMFFCLTLERQRCIIIIIDYYCSKEILMFANLSKKTGRLICLLLSFTMLLGFVPVRASADSKYDKYIKDLEDYNARVAAYEKYQSDLDYYNEHNAEWADYDAKLAAYNSYQQYLSDLAAYNEAIETYPSRLEAYNAYTLYVESCEKCEAALVVIEAVMNGDMYDTLNSETVDAVIDSKDKIGAVANPKYVEDAGDATVSLRRILSNYSSKSGIREKFEYYKSNYSSLKSNFHKLYTALNSLYNNDAVQQKLVMEEKEGRYCEFLCQLYTISCCLDDSKSVNINWGVSYSGGTYTYRQLGGYAGLRDTNSASPENYTLPEEVPAVEKPEMPVMPTQVEEVLEPIAPNSKRPINPSPVAVPGDPPSLPTYTITWKNDNGTVLKTDTVEYGVTPIYSGSAPTKAPTAQYSYSFSGWYPEPSATTGDTTYTARFGTQANSYSVTWKNYDGTILRTDTAAYNELPSYNGTPERASDAQYSYTFSGWSPAVTAVSGNATYTAQYSEATNNYTITWKDSDGTVLRTDSVAYGSTPSYGSTPTKSATAQYTYTFSGWSPAVTSVTGNATYTAQFSSQSNEYTVNWVIDGKTVKSETLAYGAMPSYSGTPTKSSTAQKNYTFSGWSPAISTVSGNVTYTAQFNESDRNYTITWKDSDGTVLRSDTLAYGATPSYGSTPTKSATAQNTYTFSGWSPAVTAVSGNATYTAKYSETTNNYTITWKDSDGTVLRTDSVAYGSTPSYGSTPTKSATAQYTYTFSGWSPAVTSVAGNATYTAQFSSKVNEYTVTWKNEDGKTLDTNKLAYGATPSYSGATPTKPGTQQTSYMFDKWSPAISEVTGDVTYTATFTASTNKYTVTWNNYDGTALEVDENVEYGTTPSYNKSTPQKASDGQHTYTFAGWSPAVTSVTGNATYTATFTESVNKYTVTWKDSDGKELRKDSFEYGATPSYGSDPTKDATAQYTYTFTGWSPNVTAVTGNATYTAQFSSQVNEYAVTWVVDGKTVKTDKLAYGATPTYGGSPTKDSTTQNTYTFTGWSPAISTVSGNVTYTAQFTESDRNYTVTWKDSDGTVLRTDTVAYGATPSYGSDPTKAATAQYTYTFSGWSPVVSKVTGDATYVVQYNETVNKYTVTWKDADGKELRKDSFEYGATPSYGSDPTKAATAQYTYTFTGWSPEITAVSGNVTYTAKFSESTNEYKITWQNHDGSVLKTDTLAYDTMPSYGGTAPTKEATAQYTYTFSGWSPVVSKVTGDATYEAQFTEAVNKYNVTWQNYDGSLLKTDSVEYGVLPEYSGKDPQKEGNAQYTYKFSGWSPAIIAVTKDAVYTATFETAENSYTVTWKNHDGTVLKTDTLKYGETPSYVGAPIRESNEQYTYTFTGWSPEIKVVDGDVIYTAQYSEKVNEYIVTWQNFDGTVLKTDKIAYGTLPSYDGQEPKKESTAKFSYVFSGWTPKIVEVKQDATYTAEFGESINQYTVTWKDGDIVLQTDTLDYGEMPVFRGSTDKESTKEKTFEFLGWSPKVTEVTEDVVYVASYKETKIYYRVIWRIGDTVLPEQLYEYMQDPKVPQKPEQYLTDDEKTWMKFTGWNKKVEPVTENVTYIATFYADIFDLPKENKNAVSLMPSENLYTVISDKEEITIGLEKLAQVVASKEKDLVIQYNSGIQIYFPNKLANEIIEKKLHVLLVMGNTVREFELLSSNLLENTSEEDTIFGGRVILTDDEGNIVPLAGWQLRVPIENGNMSGLSGYSIDDTGEQSYKLSQAGNYAVFVSDGSSEFKLIRRLSVRVDASEGGNVSFSEIKAGESVKANINVAIGYEIESIEVYYESEGEKVLVDFDAETSSFIMPSYNVVFDVRFRKLIFTVNFYVDSKLYSTATYGYGDDIVLPETPTKSDGTDVTYDFVGWDPAITAKVVQSVDYNAVFNASTVAGDDYGDGDYGFYIPILLLVAIVVFFGGIGVSIYLIVHFARKRKKRK